MHQFNRAAKDGVGEAVTHDRGHIAPRQAFSWHVCATYQTFSMANMSPQRAFLNGHIWAHLEQQVLTWAVDVGPIYVVTGVMFRRFPHERFEVYTDGVLNPTHIYPPGSTMLAIAEAHHQNFATSAAGDNLRPSRDANTDRIPARTKALRMPTGYFKVIYRPENNGEPPRAIAFLLPHTFENLNLLTEHYSNIEARKAFWVFVSTIELVEEVSGIRFPGISSEMKSVWGDDFFFARNRSRDIRDKSCGDGTPTGILENSTKEERIAACIDLLR